MATLHEAETVVRRFWDLMESNDFHSVADVLHPGFELEWPQSGERIRGAFNFGEMNRNYPAKGRWRFEIERLVADGNGAVTVVNVSDGEMRARAITFFEMADGMIRRIVEYWPEPFDAAAWRREWVDAAGR